MTDGRLPLVSAAVEHTHAETALAHAPQGDLRQEGRWRIWNRDELCDSLHFFKNFFWEGTRKID